MIDSGALSGALNPDSLEAQTHANQYYVAVRKMKTDISRIAQNTGYSIDKITAIKEHVFLKRHDLGEGEKEYFYPYYEIAQSWQRLIDGRNIQPYDYVLLEHEYMEQALMSKGFTQRQAHDMTDEVYNYAQALSGR